MFKGKHSPATKRKIKKAAKKRWLAARKARDIALSYRVVEEDVRDENTELVRHFDSGATRALDAHRIDPEGTLSPLALERYCEYMNKHRLQPDGSIRDTDNWQLGIPLHAYVKGLWRHMLHFWQRYRGWSVVDSKAAIDIEEDLCAVIFNAQGYLHEILKEKRKVEK